jgi:hypothetical protein
MSIALSFRGFMSGQTDVRSAMPLPIVYENVPVEPTRWEYRVVTIDVREEDLPDAARLNELGDEGWLLVGMVDQKSNERSGPVHFYFVRQKTE